METSRLRRFISNKSITLIVLLAVIIAFYGIGANVTGRGVFFSLTNLRTILNSMSVVAMLTIGAGCLIISGNIDLSAGFVGTFCGVMVAHFSTNLGLPWGLSLLCAIIAGALFGFLNAFLVNELNIQAFVATLATGYIAEGLSYIVSGGIPIQIDDQPLVWLGSGMIGQYIPVSIFIAIMLFLVYGIIMSSTKFGRSAYYIGGNRTAAWLTGMNPKKISYFLFVNSSALAALSGILLASRTRAGTLTGTSLSNFAGITAAILGGVSFGGGAGGMGGAFMGLLIINSFNNGMLIMQVQSYYQNIASGMLLLVALLLDYMSVRGIRKKIM